MILSSILTEDRWELMKSVAFISKINAEIELMSYSLKICVQAKKSWIPVPFMKEILFFFLTKSANGTNSNAEHWIWFGNFFPFHSFLVVHLSNHHLNYSFQLRIKDLFIISFVYIHFLFTGRLQTTHGLCR